MQAIAREFNLSETTFVERRSGGGRAGRGRAGAHLHHPGGAELCRPSHAGHGQRAQARAPETVQGGTVTCGSTWARCRCALQREGLFGEMTQPDPEFGAELDPREVARLTGLDLEDLDPGLPPQIVSTGTAFAIVALRSAEASGPAQGEPAGGYGVAAGARYALVLCAGANWRRRNAATRLARPHAVLRRRGSGYRLGGRLRHQLPGPARRRGCGQAHSSPSGRRDRPRQRLAPVSAIKSASARNESARVADVRVAGQHCSCGKRTAFPAVMHMLSTGIHRCK